MSPARPLAQLRTQCPYCDHVSPADSKFCNECGAALHLMPCPHCGAVNDLTLTAVCARCNGDLQAAPAAAATPMAPRSEKPPATLTLVTEPMPDTAEPPLQAAAAARPPWGVWGAVLLLGLAGLGYYAYTPEPGPGLEPAPARVAQPAPAAAVVAQPAPEPVVQEPAPPPVAEAPSKPLTGPKAKPARSSPPTAATNAATSTAAAEPAPRPRNNPEPPPPRIGPCTDAVAALGLCNAESPNRKQ